MPVMTSRPRKGKLAVRSACPCRRGCPIQPWTIEPATHRVMLAIYASYLRKLEVIPLSKEAKFCLPEDIMHVICEQNRQQVALEGCYIAI